MKEKKHAKKIGMKRRREDLDEGVSSQVGYVYSENLIQYACKLPNIKNRALLVHNLIESYDLLRNTVILEPTAATEEDLSAFHSSDYVKYLKSINSRYTPDDEVALEYGLGYDCPPLDGIFDYCRVIGGATLTASRALAEGQVDVAINWCGGWHHAQRDEAEGFCYVNDVVLGILELRKTFNYILYVDLDVHHGNGVEAAFEYTPKVMTLSFHQYEPGFYPGSGGTFDVGSGLGQYHSVNVPLMEGISDKRYCEIFDTVWEKVLRYYEFDAVVVQCGTDGLSGDPLGGFNLTEEAYGHCLQKILGASKRTLVLGGGGYHVANSARCWAYLTSVIVGCAIDADIPEHDYFSMYGPSYELKITPSHRKDSNTQGYVDKVLREIEDNLSHLASA